MWAWKVIPGFLLRAVRWVLDGTVSWMAITWGRTVWEATFFCAGAHVEIQGAECEGGLGVYTRT